MCSLIRATSHGRRCLIVVEGVVPLHQLQARRGVVRAPTRLTLASVCQLALVAVLAAGCSESAPDTDLDRAIDAGVGRSVSAPRWASRDIAWTDVAVVPENADLLHVPRALCWLGADLLVADGGDEAVRSFDDAGAHLWSIGGVGEGPGEFRAVRGLACAPSGQAFAAADMVGGRLTFFDSKGSFVDATPLPPVPAGWPHFGEVVLADDGTWFDSWINERLGPALDDEAWREESLIRKWAPDGTALGAFGTPREFENPVLRRVFNHVDAVVERDTLWVLLKGSAEVRPFSLDGTSAGSGISLPVYHRGDDPVIETDAGAGSIGRNQGAYQPNVGGIAMIRDSLFAVIRYRDWRSVTRGSSTDEFWDYWPDSFIEVVTRDGRAIAGIRVPGRAEQIASDGGSRVAVLSTRFDYGITSVLVGRLPSDL